MNLRLANQGDLPQLKAVYRKIIDTMNQNGIQIWDEIYPCEFFDDDIENNRLYVLAEGNTIVSAFALCRENAGADCVKWENEHSNALYIDRLGVNAAYARKGIGSITLQKAVALAGKLGAGYLRLFVVDSNIPAINLYVKNDFLKAEGIYEEVIDEDLMLYEFGYEKKTSM